MRLRILALLLPCFLFAQDGMVVNQSSGAPPLGYTKILNYTGSNLSSTCVSRSYEGPNSPRSRIKVSISAATNANPVVLTSTGHGFPTSSRPSVTISGGTGSWTAINLTNTTATVIDANTFSIAVDSTAFGALAGTITFTTTAARTTVAEWAVQKFAYDVSNNLIWSGWLTGSSGYASKCSDASSTTNNQQ